MAEHKYVPVSGPMQAGRHNFRPFLCCFCGAEPVPQGLWMPEHWSIADAQRISQAQRYCPEHTDHLYREANRQRRQENGL